MATQRIGLTTSLDSLRADLDTGDAVDVCFLFEKPRRNWIGNNDTVRIFRQVAIGNQVVVDGTRTLEHGFRQQVTLLIDTTTGEGFAVYGKTLTDQDVRVLELSFGAVNATA